MCCNIKKYYLINKYIENMSDYWESDNEIYKHKMITDSSDEEMPDVPLHETVLTTHYGSLPDILYFNYVGRDNRGKLFPVTVTMNVKHELYEVINDPYEFKEKLQDFCKENYIYNLNGILEFHKPKGTFREGGLHLHGLCAGRQPPKGNTSNLFHFYIVNPHKDEDGGIVNYIKYCKKNIKDTLKKL